MDQSRDRLDLKSNPKHSIIRTLLVYFFHEYMCFFSTWFPSNIFFILFYHLYNLFKYGKPPQNSPCYIWCKYYFKLKSESSKVGN